MPSLPASRVEIFNVTIPAGTPVAAPLETPTPWVAGELVGLEVFIPDGHSGLTGLRLAVAHGQIIPRTEGTWLVGNDETIRLDTVGYPNSGAWSAIGYNVDSFDHTFFIRYLVADFAYTPQALQGASLIVPPVT